MYDLLCCDSDYDHATLMDKKSIAINKSPEESNSEVMMDDLIEEMAITFKIRTYIRSEYNDMYSFCQKTTVE